MDYNLSSVNDRILDKVGQAVVRKSPPKKELGNAGKQLDAIADMISRAAQEEGYPLRSLRMAEEEYERVEGYQEDFFS